jgi:hypothetical protein
MRPEEDEKRTEARVHNTPKQRGKDGKNGTGFGGLIAIVIKHLAMIYEPEAVVLRR